MPLASARQHPENQKENQAGHSSERTVEDRRRGIKLRQHQGSTAEGSRKHARYTKETPERKRPSGAPRALRQRKSRIMKFARKRRGTTGSKRRARPLREVPARARIQHDARVPSSSRVSALLFSRVADAVTPLVGGAGRWSWQHAQPHAPCGPRPPEMYVVFIFQT